MKKPDIDDVILNKDGIPIWKGFIEIKKETAVSLFEKGEAVYIVDDEGHESLAQDRSYFEDYNAYVIEKTYKEAN